MTLLDAARQALDVMGNIGADLVCGASHHWPKDLHKDGKPCSVEARWHQVFRSLRQAIEQAEQQEPVGEIVQGFADLVAVSIPVMPPVGTKLYTTPPQQEPVAWGIANTRPTESKPLMMVMLDEPPPSHLVIPLYTTPPQRKPEPLSDDEIAELMMKAWGCASIAPRHAPAFARAIERAHGIGEQHE